MFSNSEGLDVAFGFVKLSAKTPLHGTCYQKEAVDSNALSAFETCSQKVMHVKGLLWIAGCPPENGCIIFCQRQSEAQHHNETCKEI